MSWSVGYFFKDLPAVSIVLKMALQLIPVHFLSLKWVAYTILEKARFMSDDP